MNYGIIYFKDNTINILTPDGEQRFNKKNDFIKATVQFDELFIETNKMDALHGWLEIEKPITSTKLNSMNSKQQIYFKVGGTPIKSIKYFLGSDKLSPQQCLDVYKHHARWNHGYTQTLRDEIGDNLSQYMITDKALRDKLRSLVPTCPFIYSKNNIEFSNVQRWDGRKQYPALYCGKLPCNPVEITTDQIVDDPKYVHFVPIWVDRAYPLHRNYYPLGIAKEYEKEKHFIKNGVQFMGVRDPFRYSFWGWYEETVPLIQGNYNCTLRIPKGHRRCWRFELKEIPELQNIFYNLIELEEATKGDKAGIKQMRNRLHGFFGMDYWTNKKGTLRHWFTYVIAKQLNTMDLLAHMIGFENIVSGHTDSLYTLNNATPIIKQFNNTIDLPYGIGKFKEEHFALKIERYSAIRAKILTKEEGIVLTHGGIPDEAVKELLDSGIPYDDITKDTIFYVPTDWEIIEDEFGIELFPVKGCNISLGTRIEDEEYCYR